MPTPKRKLSRKRRDQRAANKGLAYRAVAACLTCHQPSAPHQVCKECGYYKGKKILRTRTDRMYARTQARHAEQQRMQSAGVPESSDQGPASQNPA